MEPIVAAIDLGTSKMIAIVARKQGDGDLSILCKEEFKSANSIRRGCIFNLDVTTTKVSGLIGRVNHLLKSQSNGALEKIYVGIGGQSLRTESYNVKKVVDNGIVTKEILDSLDKEADSYKPEFAETLTILKPEYYLDNSPEPNPKGATASMIEARFMLIVGNPSLKLNPERVFKGLKDPVKPNFIISPLATAEAVLKKNEKEVGCVLVELGAGITYVSVYKNGLLRYLATIPLGGSVIDKDIRSLNVSKDETENLKIKYGSVVLSPDNTEKVKVGENTDFREVSVKDLNMIIEARMYEIIANVIAQIDASGYSKSLDAGIIITGGGALLRDVTEWIAKKTGMKVRLATAKAIQNQTETIQSAGSSCIIGLLKMGEEHCLSVAPKQSGDLFPDEPIVRKLPESSRKGKTSDTTTTPPSKEPKPKSGIGRKLGQWTNFLFSDENSEENSHNDVDGKGKSY
jgi:cell division protein FtsA